MKYCSVGWNWIACRGEGFIKRKKKFAALSEKSFFSEWKIKFRKNTIIFLKILKKCFKKLKRLFEPVLNHVLRFSNNYVELQTRQILNSTTSIRLCQGRFRLRTQSKLSRKSHERKKKFSFDIFLTNWSDIVRRWNQSQIVSFTEKEKMQLTLN